MSIRLLDGGVPVDFHHSTRPSDLDDSPEFLLLVLCPGSTPFDNDSLSACLPEVLNAQEQDQSDLQAVQPADLQRHAVLPVLYVPLRTPGRPIFR